MAAWIATILTCWCCALLARPRRPRPGNEVEELVYARLLGRQQLLLGIAAVVTALTMLALIVILPRRLDPTLGEARLLDQYCTAAAAGRPSCYRMYTDGRWAEAVQMAGGQWTVIGVVPAPPTDTAPNPGPNPEYSRGG